jgi:glycosyltransferase involved in cell wall biosynthesis
MAKILEKGDTNLHVAVLLYTASGGLSTYALELSEALVRRGLDVTLFGVRQCAVNEKFQYMTIPHIEVLKKIRDPLVWNMSIGARVTNILRSSSIDIVHCVYPALVPFIRLRKPIVCSGWFSPHNLQARLSIAIRMFPFSFSRLGELWGQTEYFFLDDFGYRSSRSIFAVTKALEENLRGRFGSKVRYLPPGINLISRKRMTGGQKVRIACIASDLENPRKGLSTLLRALTLLEPSLYQRVELLLIGNYSYRLENEVEMLRRKGFSSIRLSGYVQRERIIENLLQIDLLVCPSLYEEFGYVVLEAMSAGVPVIATKVRPLTDIILHGVSGLLFEKENIRELSSLISMLIMDQEIRSKMGEEAQKRAIEEFGWDSIALKLENYYREILETSQKKSYL